MITFWVNVKHYENAPMLYEFFFFFFFFFFNVHLKNIDFLLLLFVKNIDCGYLLEPPRIGGGSNEFQSTFWSKKRNEKFFSCFFFFFFFFFFLFVFFFCFFFFFFFFFFL